MIGHQHCRRVTVTREIAYLSISRRNTSVCLPKCRPGQSPSSNLYFSTRDTRDTRTSSTGEGFRATDVSRVDLAPVTLSNLARSNSPCWRPPDRAWFECTEADLRSSKAQASSDDTNGRESNSANPLAPLIRCRVPPVHKLERFILPSC